MLYINALTFFFLYFISSSSYFWSFHLNFNPLCMYSPRLIIFFKVNNRKNKKKRKTNNKKLILELKLSKNKNKIIAKLFFQPLTNFIIYKNKIPRIM